VEFVAAITGGCLDLHWRSPAGGLGPEILRGLADATRLTLQSWADLAHSQLPSTDGQPEGDARASAAALRRHGYAPLVRIRERPSDRPPLFLIHPAGGTVLCYRDLAERLDVTCYGLQAPGLADGEQPIESVEILADVYLDTIVKVSPTGPYRLAGWSFGGVVAFEIARRLQGIQPGVELLAVLDVHAPGAVPEPEWDKDSARLLVDIFAEDLGVEHDDLRSRPFDEQLGHITSRAIACGVFPAGFTLDMARRAWQVFQAHRRAERRYRATPIGGELLLFTSDVRKDESNPCLGWDRWVDRVVRRSVPGNHQQILRAPSVNVLARVLLDYVDK
jgi:thioesterase domain-containing protein